MRRKIMIRPDWLVTAVLCVVVGSVHAGQEAVVRRGEAIYKAYCAPCHGVTGQGDGEMAPLLGSKPSDLTRLARTNGGRFPFWAVFAIVEGEESIRQHGSREMPVWGTWFAGEQGSTDPAAWIDLTRGRIWQLIIYLESVQAD